MSIVPNGRITTTTFRPQHERMLSDWLESRAGHENIYFQVNDTGEKSITKKPTKADIVAADWVHVDVDPSADPSLFDAERKRILKKLKGHSPAPTLIIDSGNGYQAFWKLAEPVRVTSPSEEAWADFERYNRQLETDLGGDHCFNVDRIMRLPGTINVPNKKKRTQGRTERLAKLVHKADQSVELSLFPQAPLLDGGDQGDVGRARVQLSGNLPRLSEIDDLDQHGEVPQYVKMLCVQGLDPDNPDRYPSRSECFWFVLCELVRCEIPDDVIASIMMDPDFLISGHVLDQRNSNGYMVRQLQRAHECAINPALPSLNDNHFVTMVGGKIKVGYEAEDGEISFMDPGSFEKFYSNQRVEIGQTKEGMPITQKLGKWWMEHKDRRSYKDGIVFSPSGEAPPQAYNLWKGFACQAVAGSAHERWLEHVFENVCNGNDEHYKYTIGWAARLVQNPATQSETALVMRGKEGTGKNTFVGTLGSFFPRHYFESSSSGQFLGNFNAHLRDKVLVHANEAFFAGDKKHEATLKMIVTEEMMPIEAKGVDITRCPNYLHVVMSSNSDWVVPAGPDSRRFMVLDVSDKRLQDSSYFAKIKNELNNGGRENLLRFLMDYDLSDYNVRRVPITEALLDQRMRTMPKLGQWWMARLDRGYVINPEDGWSRELEVEHVWHSYVKDMQDQSEHYRATRIELGKFLSRACPGIQRKRVQTGGGGKRPVYHLPTLEECRDQFDDVMGGPFEWSATEADVQDDIPF
ncbi:gp33 [Alphaproteobacteria phage PhiJL001]|uniref:Gp33 n=1 Tax=Alphaproteobacteria phage PhiJL001 TaxID=2681607 RepID=Q5DN72_9CAUD|nr:DNA primase [Alphaproteobacteria phage PhiJL001]AAT69509.1 gp33 [Alphaproteobacteria phage PhiJL001]